MPQTTDPLATIQDLLENRAAGRYGLADLSQQAHALQAALLAERDGGPDAMIAAALLHDIGHLVHHLGENPASQGIDDHHEDLGWKFLRRWFGPQVTEPVRLHVAAKRYLCAVDPDYAAILSADSVRSLALQGGPMSPAEVDDFASLPGAADAVRLRRYDEGAKVAGLATPDVAHFMPAVARCLMPA
jgi:phosphonate degradation associated HDIG domain protein